MQTIKIEHEGKTYTGTYFVHPDNNRITVNYGSISETAELQRIPGEGFAQLILHQLVKGRKLGLP